MRLLQVGEISVLRVELESAKKNSTSALERAEEAEARTDDLLERLREVENEKAKVNTSVLGFQRTHTFGTRP